MTLKAVTKLAILLVALAALALPLTGTPVSAAQGNTQGEPTISGILRVGETLTADISTFSDPDGIAAVNLYQWRRHVGGTETIKSQGSSFTTYTLLQADLGAEITVEVWYLDANGAQEMTRSSRVGPVLPAFDDRPALMALYDSTGGANWDDNTNWNTTAALGTWRGVETDINGRVTGLVLPENNLVGTLPAKLGDLGNLEVLSLHNNELSGAIPAELGDLDNLEILILSDNADPNIQGSGLTGAIPAELGDLDNLKRLYLSYNKLTGAIPAELGDLDNLAFLLLHGNQLSGAIPAELGDLDNLAFLFLHGNQLSGEIPASMGRLTNLYVVRFANNQLTGCVPEGLLYLLTAPDFSTLPAHDFIGVDANGDGDYDDDDDTPGLNLPFCGVGELSALNLSGVTINPAFANRRETYTGTAPYEVVSTTVTAELNRPQDAFTIEKDGDIYTSGDAVPLIAGSSSPNVVTIEVTLPDSSTARTYTVVVTRQDRARELVTVPSNWSLIPDGFGPGEQFRLLFVTGEDRDATSSSIADYDAFVREQAAQGHASIRSHSSKFRVVGSTEGFGARGHTGTTDVGVPIYYLNGEKIADNYNDFYDGSWDSVEPRDENGDVLTFVAVWTGTQSDGTCPSHCLGSQFTTIGRPEFQDDGLDGGIEAGEFEERFYALSPIFMVGGLPQATLKDSFKPPGSSLNGIWSDGTTIWVVDDEFHDDVPDTIRAYRKSDQTRDDEKDITGRTMKAAGNVKSRGIWSDGMTMWVADSREDKIFAYDKTTRQRDESKDFYTLKAAGNNEPSGIWSDGMTMWVADPSDNKIYAYRMSDKSRDPDKDFDILSDNHNPRANLFIRAGNTRTWLDNTNPHGIWSDGATMWVTNTLIASTNRIYAYRMSDWSRDGARDLILPTHDADARKDNKFPRHIWSDGTDLYVSDGYSDRIFVYSLPQGSSAQQNKALRAPGQPQKVGVTNRGVDEMTLNWDPPDSDGGSAITSYTVAYEPDDSSSKSTRRTSRSHIERYTDTPPGSTQVTTTGTSFTVTGLTGGTEYSFRVIATNDVGDGPPSEEVLGTPREQPPLEAEFPSSPYSSQTHSGTDDRPQVVVAFSRPVASFTASTPSVSVGGATVTSVQAHEEEEEGLENAYMFFLDPVGTDAIEFRLAPKKPCDSGGICAQDGTTLSVVPVTHTILGPPAQNSPATGHPTISGTVRVGETLTASISGIDDSDGLDNAVFSYLWIAGGSDIGGAAGSSYTVVDADQGKTIKVRVTFTDDEGNEETLTSQATAAVSARSNSPATGAPTISGTVRVDETLTAGTSDIADADGLDNVSFSYQWIAGGTDIAGATGSSYAPLVADLDKTIKVRVSFDDDRNFLETLTSEATATVIAAVTPLTAEFQDAPDKHLGTGVFTFDIAFSEPISIGYKTLRDDSLEVTNGSATKAKRADGQSDRWKITVEPDSDAAVTVVLPITEDCGAQGAVCSRAGGNERRPLSNRSELTVPGPAAANSPATGAPIISGTAQVGETLTVDTSGIDDADGISGAVFSYQWLANDAEITGATGDTYILVEADVGKAVKVRVIFNDDDYNEETLTSPATAAVAAETAVPDAPQSLNVSPDDTGTLDVSWEAPAGDGSSAITAYKVQWKSGSEDYNGSAGSTRQAEITDPASRTHTITGLTDGVEYAVRIIAVNDEGDGPPSDEATGTPRETTPPELATATVDGTRDTLTLTYDETLDEASEPSSDAFSVTVGGTGRAVDGVSVSGSSVTLTLGSAVASGATVTVSYAAPTDAAVPRIQDEAGNPAASFSDQAVVNNTPSPANTPATGAPTISGTAQVGETLTVDTSDIADAEGLDNVGYSYQWLANGADIAGATSSSYTLVDADKGKTIQVKVSFRDDKNNQETLTSAATAAVEPRPNSPATGAPSISGTVRVGEILTAETSAIADADGLSKAVFIYQWLADDADIAGATSDTYALVDADLDKAVKVRVIFNDNADNEETLTSEATAAVAPRPNSPATGAPTISGTAEVGETLTVDTSGIADADGMSGAVFSYQWLADDADIAGATSDTYTPVADDVGKAIKVKVSFRDDRNHQESLTSAATAAAAADDSAVWSATLTVGSLADFRGFWKDVGMGELTSEVFTLDGVDYTVKALADSNGLLFNLTLDQALPVGFTLQVGATTLSSQDASILEYSSGATQYGWANQGVMLADVDTVEVSLTLAE